MRHCCSGVKIGFPKHNTCTQVDNQVLDMRIHSEKHGQRHLIKTFWRPLYRGCRAQSFGDSPVQVETATKAGSIDHSHLHVARRLSISLINLDANMFCVHMTITAKVCCRNDFKLILPYVTYKAIKNTYVSM